MDGCGFTCLLNLLSIRGLPLSKVFVSVFPAEKSVHFQSIAEAQKLGTEPPPTSCWPPVLSYSRDVIKTSPQAEPHLFQYNPPGT